MAANWWGISAQIVAWLGVAVVALAIIGPWIMQRIKRRRRCPKCWYDMSHSPGLTCSECGYTAKRKRKLFKARRRWKVAFLGVFMLIGAYALNVTPAVKDRGWPAAVPLSVKITIVPWLNPDCLRGERWQDRIYADVQWSIQYGSSYSAMHDRLLDLVTRRNLSSHECGAEVRWPTPLDRLLAGTSWDSDCGPFWPEAPAWAQAQCSEFKVEATTRPKWVRGRGIALRIEPCFPTHGIDRNVHVAVHDQQDELFTDWIASPLTIHTDFVPRDVIELGATSDSSITVNTQGALTQQARSYFVRPRRTLAFPSQESELSFEFVDDVHELLRPVSSERFYAELRSPRVHIWFKDAGSGHRATLILDLIRPTRTDSLPHFDEVTVAMRIALKHNDTEVADGRFSFRPRAIENAASAKVELQIRNEQLLREILDATGETFRGVRVVTERSLGEGWSVTITGDPFVALRDFEATHYWEGKLIVPVAVEFRPYY